MGNKLWVVGITLIIASKEININIPAVTIVGAVIACLGAILVCLDK